MGQANKYTGETPIKINGTNYTLIFDMGAIAFIQSQCGQDALDDFMQVKDAHKIAQMILAGLQRRHKDALTLEDILASDLGMVPAKAAIGNGLMAALFGPEGAAALVDELDESDKKKPAAKNAPASKKKTKY